MIKVTNKVLEVLKFGAEHGHDGYWYEQQFNDGRHVVVVARTFNGAYTAPEVEAVLKDVYHLQTLVDAFGHTHFRALVALDNIANA